MTEGTNLKNDSTVIKCKITITKSGDGYDVRYDPEVVSVTLENTDLHFHIDEKSSDNVEIDSVTANPPGQTQLVNGQVSSNRQQFNIKDLNTSAGTFSLAFSYKDKQGNKLAKNLKVQGIDIPEIENNPPVLAMSRAAAIDIPEIENNPPV